MMTKLAVLTDQVYLFFLFFLVNFLVVVVSLVVSTGTVDCLERLVSETTCFVSSRM